MSKAEGRPNSIVLNAEQVEWILSKNVMIGQSKTWGVVHLADERGLTFCGKYRLGFEWPRSNLIADTVVCKKCFRALESM